MLNKKTFPIIGIGLMLAIVGIITYSPQPIAVASTRTMLASDNDADDDGYPDCYEKDKYTNDHDNDEIKNADDTDDDNDGILDTEEKNTKYQYDVDNDGTVDANENYTNLTDDTDEDKDGILDAVEQKDYISNHDNDGKKDSDDGDDDRDGLADSDEEKVNRKNHDNDGKKSTRDQADNDDDGDGTKDWEEANCKKIYDNDNDGTADIDDTDDDLNYPLDTDGDGIPDKEDADANGDGYTDAGNETLATGDDFTAEVGEEGRVWYGYMTYNDEDPGANSTTTEKATWIGRFEQIGEGLYLSSISGSGTATRVANTPNDPFVDEYNVTADMVYSYAEPVFTGNIDSATGDYSIGIGAIGDAPAMTATYGENDEGTVEFDDVGAGGGDPECEPDFTDNVTGTAGDCAYTVSTTGEMSGTYEDRAEVSGSVTFTRLEEWLILPTICSANSECDAPDASYPPES